MDAANFLVDICKLICLDVDYRPGDGSAEDGGGSAEGCVHSRVDIMKFGSKRFYIRGSVARADPSILACRVARALKSSGITPGLKVTLFIPSVVARDIWLYVALHSQESQLYRALPVKE